MMSHLHVDVTSAIPIHLPMDHISSLGGDHSNSGPVMECSVMLSVTISMLSAH